LVYAWTIRKLENKNATMNRKIAVFNLKKQGHIHQSELEIFAEEHNIKAIDVVKLCYDLNWCYNANTGDYWLEGDGGGEYRKYEKRTERGLDVLDKEVLDLLYEIRNTIKNLKNRESQTWDWDLMIKHNDYKQNRKKYNEEYLRTPVAIWCGQRGGYWKQDKRGYTTDNDLIGFWNMEIAASTVEHVGPEKLIEFHVPNLEL
jgi:hypothetical protein